MVRLKTIEITGLRGARGWEIALEGKGLVLWGENASGKSSLVDALEFLFTGTIRHLEGTMGISVGRHAHHIDMDRTEMNVSAVFDPGAVAIERTYDNAPEIPDSIKQYWREGGAGAFILRRAQLLTFIFNDPADRFRAIATMIGADSLDATELAMLRVKDAHEGDWNSSREQVNDLKRELQQLVPGDNIISTINAEAAALGLAPIESLDTISQRVLDWQKAAKTSDQAKATRLQQLIDTASAADVPEGFREELTSFSASHAALYARRQQLAQLAEAEMLQKAVPLLKATPAPQQCPLCEQSIVGAQVLERIQQRLATLQGLTASMSRLRVKQQELSNELAGWFANLSNLQRKLAAQEEPDEDAKRTVDATLAAVSQMRAQIRIADKLTQPMAIEAVMASITGWVAKLGQLQAAVSKRQSALNLTPRDKSIVLLSTKVVRTADLAERLRVAGRRSADLRVRSALSSRVVTTFSEVKKRVFQETYDAIASDVARFYEILHPEEPHTDLRLVLSEARRASTDLRIRAFGRADEDPRAYSSEGHLDSLGLCIFLAFVKTFRSGLRFMVLDDVVMSIDSGHRSRIAGLLFTEFADWQIVITTHDELWMDELLAHQRAFNLGSRFVNLRIERWSLGEGPVCGEAKPRWEKIEDRLAAADKRSAANLTRTALEWVLREICILTIAPVAIRRDNRYTVGDLQNPASARLLKLFPGKRTEIESLFQEITASATPGNLLSHENAEGERLGVPELRRFYAAVKGLADWFACGGCGRMPMYLQEARELRCVYTSCGDQKRWATQ